MFVVVVVVLGNVSVESGVRAKRSRGRPSWTSRYDSLRVSSRFSSVVDAVARRRRNVVPDAALPLVDKPTYVSGLAANAGPLARIPRLRVSELSDENRRRTDSRSARTACYASSVYPTGVVAASLLIDWRARTNAQTHGATLSHMCASRARTCAANRPHVGGADANAPRDQPDAARRSPAQFFSFVPARASFNFHSFGHFSIRLLRTYPLSATGSNSVLACEYNLDAIFFYIIWLSRSKSCWR